MRIEKCSSPSFGAIFYNRVNVGKLQQDTNRYNNSVVSFVRIEPDNSDDINALEKCSKYWQYSKFTTNIYHAANAMKNDSPYYKQNNVFALTSQCDNFEKLDNDKILGLVHVSPFNDGSLFIEHIQVKPDLIYLNKPEYKGVGTGILNSLKELTGKICLFPSSEKSVRDFYEKNGFFEYPVGMNIYTWVKDIFPRF